MPRDTNPQGIGLRPEERTVQQILYQRQHQAEIREQIEAQRNGHLLNRELSLRIREM